MHTRMTIFISHLAHSHVQVCRSRPQAALKLANSMVWSKALGRAADI